MKERTPSKPTKGTEPRRNTKYLSRDWRILFVALVTVSVIFSIPFFRPDRFSWTEMNPYLQGMVFTLTAALFCQASFSFGVGNTLVLFVISFLVSYAAEGSGVRWAWPFSSQYHYDPALVPMLPGGVPLCIPLMWFMLAYTPLVFLRPFAIRPRDYLSPSRMILKATLCGLYVTAADLVIDPLGVLFKAWFWHEPGGYFGVPVGNFSGWFLVGFVVCGSSLLLEKPHIDAEYGNRLAPDGLFAAVSVFLTLLCFAGVVIHIGTLLPAALSLIVMGPCWVYWVVSVGKIRRKLPDS